MSEIIGEAYVLVRPNVTGFLTEATGPVSKAGRDLGKVFATAFAVGGVVETLKSVVEAASAHQSAFAVLERTVQNAGASNDLYGQSIEALLEKEARLKGFSDEQLASAFQRLVSVTHDSGKAFDDLQKAEDLARFRHIDVAQAALALSKAEQGNMMSLLRYGIAAVKVTAETDQLKAAHDRAITAGAKFTTEQKAAYEAALKVAAAHDKQASAAATLAEVEQRVGGASATYANTAAGAWDRLQQDFHQAEVSLGEQLLPPLTKAAEAAGRWFTEVAQNKGVQEEFRQGVHDIGTGFHDVEEAVKTVGPPIVHLADDLGGVTKSVEVLAGAWASSQLLGKLLGTGAAAKTAGRDAAAAAGEVGILSRALTRLGALGIITVGGEVLLNGKKFDQGVGNFLDQHGLGFLGGTQESQLRDLTYKQLQQGAKFDGSGLLKQVAVKVQQDAENGGANSGWARAFIRSGRAAGDVGAKGFFEGFTSVFTHGGAALTAAGDAASIDETVSGIVSRIEGVMHQVAQSVKSGKAHDAAAAAGNATVKALRDGITSDQTDLQQIRTDLADAITQGAQAVNDAVDQAKQNLNQIGQSLASEVGAIIDAPLAAAQQRLTDRQDQITAEFDRRSAKLQQESTRLTQESSRLSLAQSRATLHQLGQELILPGGAHLSDNPERALRQLEELEKRSKSPALAGFILQYRQDAIGVEQGQLSLRQQALDARKQVLDTGIQIKTDALKLLQDAATNQKTIASRRIGDLTDEFNKGALTQGEFEKRVAAVVSGAGVTPGRARRALGVAGEDQLLALERGLGLQADAITGGPRRAGTGLVPSITRPIDTLEQTTRQIAQLQKERDQKQLDEAKKTNKLLTTIAGLREAAKFTGSLTHNPGAASQRQKALAGVSG